MTMLFRKFGELTVMWQDESSPSRYYCRCSCGTEVTAGEYELKLSRVTSCGCKKKAMSSQFRMEIVGLKYNKLTVTKLLPKGWVECVCDCGNPETLVRRASSIKSGNTRSCGCLLKNAGRRPQDIVGKKFNRLKVMEMLPEGKVRCLCDCGKETIKSRAYVLSGNTKSCGCLRSMAGRPKGSKNNTTHQHQPDTRYIPVATVPTLLINPAFIDILMPLEAWLKPKGLMPRHIDAPTELFAKPGWYFRTQHPNTLQHFFFGPYDTKVHAMVDAMKRVINYTRRYNLLRIQKAKIG